MGSVKKTYRTFRTSDGRVQLASLLGVGVLAAALVLGLAVLPATAGSGDPSEPGGVQPVEISYGGGSGACSADFPGRLPSAAAYELHINNPATGTYEGPDGTLVSIEVDEDDESFSFEILDPVMAAFDVVVNGGSQNTHYDYDGNGGPGPLGADGQVEGLHAPTRGNGNRLYNLSHINLCYDSNPIADLSVTKEPGESDDETFNASEGDEVVFDIVVSNAPEPVSNTTATGVEVVDTIPAGMTFVSADPVGTPGLVGNTYTWSGLTLAPGTSQTLEITLSIDADTGGSDLVNGVSVSGDQTDPNPGDDAADSVPPVTVNAVLSGTVFVDENANSMFDAGEPAEGGLTVTAYDNAGDEAGSAMSSPDGSYSIDLAPATYTVCLEARPGFEQTVPDLPPEGPPTNVNCPPPGGTGTHEAVGYTVDLSTNQSGIDFGNLELFDCDDPKTTSAATIEGVFEIFTNSNFNCSDKGTVFDVVIIDGDEVVKLLLDGGGEAAARGVITKTGAGPDFVPLTYSPEEDGTFVVLPWCNVRPKAAGDEGQFDGDIGAADYPDLSGVLDSPGVPSISCKVTEFQDILGNQVTVVFGEFLDPFYR